MFDRYGFSNDTPVFGADYVPHQEPEPGQSVFFELMQLMFQKAGSADASERTPEPPL